MAVRAMYMQGASKAEAGRHDDNDDDDNDDDEDNDDFFVFERFRAR